MQNYDDSSKKSSPPRAARWRAHFNPPPALSRRDILDRRSVAHLSDADKAYLEAYDILSAFPGHSEAICLADAAVEAQGGRTA